MEKSSSLKGGSEVVRRVAPLKLMIGLLYRELDAAKSDATVNIDRAIFESVITTLECAVEDVEARAGVKIEERRVVESATAARIAAPRV
jgi:hypothetical protein